MSANPPSPHQILATWDGIIDELLRGTYVTGKEGGPALALPVAELLKVLCQAQRIYAGHCDAALCRGDGASSPEVAGPSQAAFWMEEATLLAYERAARRLCELTWELRVEFNHEYGRGADRSPTVLAIDARINALQGARADVEHHLAQLTALRTGGFR